MKTKKYWHCVEVKIWIELEPDEDQEAFEIIENDISFTNPVWKKIKDISYSEKVNLRKEAEE